MKRLFLPILLMVTALSLTACGNAVRSTNENKNSAKPNAIKEQAPNQSEQMEKTVQNQETAGSAAKMPETKTADKSTVGSEKLAGNEPNKTSQNNIGVITKSDNAVSSADKQEVLKDLDGEISSVLKDIDSMDDISDSTLAE